MEHNKAQDEWDNTVSNQLDWVQNNQSIAIQKENFYVVLEAARGVAAIRHTCWKCQKSYAKRFDLTNHQKRNPECQPISVMMPGDIQFRHTPPAQFGSKEFFQFCETVELDSSFDVAYWTDDVDCQIEKFEVLMRHHIPLVWRNGAQYVDGMTLPRLQGEFYNNVESLLQQDWLQFPDAELQVKSGSRGEVSFLNQNGSNERNIFWGFAN